MKADIEIYRGWQISFDTENENFYCHSDQYDYQQTKNSFSASKKFIDEFIKDNVKFIPVFAEGLPESYRHGEKIKLVGIRKDGRFIYEDAKGKHQLSEYDEKKYILLEKKNEVHWADIKVLDYEIDILRSKKKLIEEKITGQSLSEFKKQFIK